MTTEYLRKREASPELLAWLDETKGDIVSLQKRGKYLTDPFSIEIILKQYGNFDNILRRTDSAMSRISMQKRLRVQGLEAFATSAETFALNMIADNALPMTLEDFPDEDASAFKNSYFSNQAELNDQPLLFVLEPTEKGMPFVGVHPNGTFVRIFEESVIAGLGSRTVVFEQADDDKIAERYYKEIWHTSYAQEYLLLAMPANVGEPAAMVAQKEAVLAMVVATRERFSLDHSLDAS